MEILKLGSNHDCKGCNMIYHSTQTNNFLWYLILRRKKTHPNTEFLPIFNGRKNKHDLSPDDFQINNHIHLYNHINTTFSIFFPKK